MKGKFGLHLGGVKVIDPSKAGKGPHASGGRDTGVRGLRKLGRAASKE